ncbi:hypothetical protein OESDEN_05404, partial [Oesophagostomum dentatum]
LFAYRLFGDVFAVTLDFVIVFDHKVYKLIRSCYCIRPCSFRCFSSLASFTLFRQIPACTVSAYVNQDASLSVVTWTLVLFPVDTIRSSYLTTKTVEDQERRVAKVIQLLGRDAQMTTAVPLNVSKPTIIAISRSASQLAKVPARLWLVITTVVHMDASTPVLLNTGLESRSAATALKHISNSVNGHKTLDFSVYMFVISSKTSSFVTSSMSF